MYLWNIGVDWKLWPRGELKSVRVLGDCSLSPLGYVIWLIWSYVALEWGCRWVYHRVAAVHRENSPITQTTPEPTLLSWGGWPREKFPPPPPPTPHPPPNPHPPPLATRQARSYRANRAPQTPLFSSPLILLRCVTEIKYAQNLRWLGNWY